MGLSNKLATKIRTKARTAPVLIKGPWDTHGTFVAAAIVRAAAGTVGQMGLRSSAFRGRDFLGLNSAARSGASTVWVEQTGRDRWSIALGVATVSYQRALDWMLDFRVRSGPDGHAVEVATPAVATSDGKQVHKGEYSEVRDLVLTGLELGQAPSLSVEEEVTAASLGGTSLPLVKVRAGLDHREMVVETGMSTSTIESRLDLLSYRRAPDPPAGATAFGTTGVRTVLVGAGSGITAGQQATVQVEDVGSHRQVRAHFRLGSVGSAVGDQILLRSASALFNEVHRLLVTVDPEAVRRDLDNPEDR